jgi:[glutamine synthetase] adenylyltransferase / [glutamine synthetase]-adenylyl-L-tyrosine phosphorylase
MKALDRRIAEALAETPLAGPLTPACASFAERRGGDAAARQLSDDVLRGLARIVATQPETAVYLSNRPTWLERAAALDAKTLAERAATLSADEDAIVSQDLEDALDALRLRRRDEMALAACADLAGLVPFEAVSEFLSLVAETTARIALALARRNLPGPEVDDAFTVVGMGKIAGREFTYHSDLDLIFLYRGGTAEIERASRLGQRLIAYLTTMTGAGIAYEVDTRLRPSGQQGMLVASLDGYERYQTREAATWEHLAMLRARPIAGAEHEAAERLARVRAHVVPSQETPWSELADLRQRVVEERARDDDGASAFKTGAGGLMDVDFLAGGGLLERGARPFPALPSVAAMLATVAPGPPAEALLADYQILRRVESRVRWVMGRGVERLPAQLERVAELVEEGLSADALRGQVAATRRRIRARYERVVASESIGAL